MEEIMGKKIISSNEAPAAVGPYSQAIEANGFVFCSGQIPIDPRTGEMVSSNTAAATEVVISNLKAVLAAAGLGLKDVVKTSVFLADMNDFAEMNEVYGRHFSDSPPARACVQAAKLPKGALVEIEAIAAK
jgi:2-iminobutanoate/2-iminopropanoate deaminase